LKGYPFSQWDTEYRTQIQRISHYSHQINDSWEIVTREAAIVPAQLEPSLMLRFGASGETFVSSGNLTSLTTNRPDSRSRASLGRSEGCSGEHQSLPIGSGPRNQCPYDVFHLRPQIAICWVHTTFRTIGLGQIKTQQIGSHSDESVDKLGESW